MQFLTVNEGFNLSVLSIHFKILSFYLWI